MHRQTIANCFKGRDYYYYESLGQTLKTGMPYSLWLAVMKEYSKELGGNWNEFEKKFGLLHDANKPDGLPVGFSVTNEPWTNSQFLMTNCSLCHTADINGKIINGLGARNLQLNKLNNTLMDIARRENFSAKTLLPTVKEQAKLNNLSWDIRSRIAVELAIKELKQRSIDNIKMDAGSGRNTPIEFAKNATHTKISKPYGYVRFPSIWAYNKRNSFGWDGSMHGDLALAAASVEFNKGMSTNYIVNNQDKWHDIYAYITTLQSPAYPKHVNSQLATKGKKIYENSCLSCHGSGDSYLEKIIPISEIGTDEDRLIAMNESLAKARNSTSFGKIVPLQPSYGYVAPPLDGIWSRAPYLHNGSIPTLYDLLQEVPKRPTIFYIGPDIGYDLDKIGLSKTPNNSNNFYKFSINSEGNKNIGHEYGTLLSEKEKKELLEYLKTF